MVAPDCIGERCAGLVGVAARRGAWPGLSRAPRNQD